MPTIISIADFFVSAHGGPHKEASGPPYASPLAPICRPTGRHLEAGMKSHYSSDQISCFPSRLSTSNDSSSNGRPNTSPLISNLINKKDALSKLCPVCQSDNFFIVKFSIVN